MDGKEEVEKNKKKKIKKEIRNLFVIVIFFLNKNIITARVQLNKIFETNNFNFLQLCHTFNTYKYVKIFSLKKKREKKIREKENF